MTPLRRSLDILRWLLPGLGVKRWLIFAVLGAILTILLISSRDSRDHATAASGSLQSAVVAQEV